MRVDLLHAQASIDWPVTQLPSFQGRIDIWLKNNIDVDVVDLDSHSPDQMIVAIKKEPLPLAFTVEAGAYINAIRSSLDILATSLAERFGIPKTKEAYFPIAASETEYRSGGYKGAKFVERLPARECSVLESLKPYKGGNMLLWSLHRLDIMRKHHRLLSVVHTPQILTIKGSEGFAFRPVDRVASGNDETILGFIPKSIFKPDMEIAAYIAFDETALGIRKPVIPVLDEIARHASAIIKMFDIP